MKIFLIVLIICSFFSIFFAQTLTIDTLTYSFAVSVNTQDTSLTDNKNIDTITGGQVDFFVYQYPIQNGSDATAGAQVILQTSPPNPPRLFGRTSLSVDAAIYGYGISTYDGIDTVSGSGHPCGNYLFHLDNEVACAIPNVASPGLQLDLSKKDVFAFEILSLDIGSGNNLIIRVWDNSGNTGCVSYLHPASVLQPNSPSIPYKPLVIFPFSSFTKGNLINWSNIRAISIEFNSTIASVDLIVGPLEALGWGAVKSSSTVQPISPNNVVTFDINLDIDQYNTNSLVQLLSLISYDITVTDTLPAELNDFSPTPFTITDQFNSPIPVNSLVVNGKTATFTFSINNTQDPKISYSTTTTTPYDFCSKTVCNNAVMTVVTKMGNTTTSKQVSKNTCVELKSTPVLTTIFQNCPIAFNNTIETVSRVCNIGNGLATSVNFVSTSTDSLSQCIPNLTDGVCTGSSCSKNLGDIPSNQCVDVPILYDCSSFATTCNPQNFTSSFTVNENFSSSSSTSQSCSLSLNPGSPNVQITNTCPSNISPSNQTSQLVSQVCNNGLGIARNVVFTHTSQGELVNCTSSINQGACNGPTCTTNLGDLEVGQCVSLEITYSCPSYAKTCTPVSFPSTVSAVEGCNTTVTPQSCSFNLNPGTPNVQITNTCPSNISPTNTSTSLRSKVCNNGDGIARNVVFTTSGSLPTTTSCTASINQLNCDGVSCSQNLGDMAANECIDIDVIYNCPSFSTACTPLTLPISTSASDDCNGKLTDIPCSFNLITGTPNVQITNTSPSNISPSNQTSQLVSQVCNNGDGIARNVVFTHTSQGELVNCISSINQGACNGPTCTTNLGDLAVGQCVSLEITYSCSSYAKTCTTVSFPSTVSAVEGCNTTVMPQSCSFNLNPGTPNVVVSNDCPKSLSLNETTGQIVSQICNKGTGIARSVDFIYTSSNSMDSCSFNLMGGICNGNNCSMNIGDLAVDQCLNLTINYDCSTFSKTCKIETFGSSFVVSETCNTTVIPTSCSFNLNPGTPQMTAFSKVCPSPLNETNTMINYIASVCNNGTGFARNVLFSQVATNALVDCTPIFPSGLCIGSSCTKNLGDIPANECVEVPISYDCSVFAKSCVFKMFSAEVTFNETCINNVANTVQCPVLLGPGTPNVQITNTCPSDISPSNQTSQLVSQVCNNGDGIARNVVFTHISQGELVNCISSINQGACNGPTCTSNLGDLAVGQCVSIEITHSCSSYAKTCTPVSFPSTVSAVEGCNTTVMPQSCSFNLNPGNPLITTEHQICPTFDSNFSTNTVSQICNKGTGIARNVVFTETPQDSLLNCVASLSNQVCAGGVCTSNLGDFQPGQCMDLTVNYDCSIYSTECIIKRFNANTNVEESCGTKDTKNTCTFRTSPSINVSVSEVVLNTVAARVNEVVTWNIRVRNSGPQTAKSFILQKTYPQYTYPTTTTLDSWSCDINRICLFNGTSLTNGQSVSNILFSVTVLSGIPIGTTQVCNSLVVMSQPNEPNCFSEASTELCAPVNSGTPDLVVKKRVYTSQYTFKVTYKNVGSGPVNNLVLIDDLQDGWSLSSSSAAAGWGCVGTKCTQNIANVPRQSSGVSLFSVVVDPLFQTFSNGSSKCWSNSVNSTFDDVIYDPTPENNFASTGLIGSSCQSCCKQESCPIQDCTLTCPPTNLVVNCPPVKCKCEVPEFWCPTCQTKPPSCDCNQCLTSGIQFA